MQPDPEKTPNSSNIQNLKEYRARLLQKLNCLIAVLQVAIAKVRRNLEAPAADLDRLTRIRTNLEKTLNICRKAKTSLENSTNLPSDLPSGLSSVVGMPLPRTDENSPTAEDSGPSDDTILNPLRPIKPESTRKPSGQRKMNYRHYVEFSSLEEFKKFRELPPISRGEVEAADIDKLAEKLQGE